MVLLNVCLIEWLCFNRHLVLFSHALIRFSLVQRWDPRFEYLQITSPSLWGRDCESFMCKTTSSSACLDFAWHAKNIDLINLFIRKYKFSNKGQLSEPMSDSNICVWCLWSFGGTLTIAYWWYLQVPAHINASVTSDSLRNTCTCLHWTLPALLILFFSTAKCNMVKKQTNH